MSPLNIHDSFNYLAHLDQKLSPQQAASELVEEFEGKAPQADLVQLLERHIAVISDAVKHPQDFRDVTPQEIRDAKNTIATFGKVPMRDTAISSLLQEASKVLAEADKVFNAEAPVVKRKKRSGLTTVVSSAYSLGKKGVGGIYGVGKKGAEQVYNVYTTTLSFFDPAQWKVSALVNKINVLLGPHRSLNNEMKTAIYQLMVKHPDIREKVEVFIEEAIKVRDKNIQLLTQKNPICFVNPNNPEYRALADVFSEADLSIQVSSKDYPSIKLIGRLLLEVAMPSNWQVLSDTPRVGLLDLQFNFSKLKPGEEEAFVDEFFKNKSLSEDARTDTMFRRTFRSHYVDPELITMKRLSAYIDSLDKKNPVPDPVVIQEITSAHGYTERLTTNIKEAISWEDVDYNKFKGLVRATRMVGFMAEDGHKKEARAVLDFSVLGNKVAYGLNVEQSIQLLNIVDLFQGEALPYIDSWLALCHNTKEKDPLSVIDKVEEIKKLGDELLSAYRNSKEKDPLSVKNEVKSKRGRTEFVDKLNKELNAIDWLDSDQKRELIRLAIDYTFNLHHGFALAMLTLGQAEEPVVSKTVESKPERIAEEKYNEFSDVKRGNLKDLKGMLAGEQMSIKFQESMLPFQFEQQFYKDLKRTTGIKVNGKTIVDLRKKGTQLESYEDFKKDIGNKTLEQVYEKLEGVYKGLKNIAGGKQLQERYKKLEGVYNELKNITGDKQLEKRYKKLEGIYNELKNVVGDKQFEEKYKKLEGVYNGLKDIAGDKQLEEKYKKLEEFYIDLKDIARDKQLEERYDQLEGFYNGLKDIAKDKQLEGRHKQLEGFYKELKNTPSDTRLEKSYKNLKTAVRNQFETTPQDNQLKESYENFLDTVRNEDLKESYMAFENAIGDESIAEQLQRLLTQATATIPVSNLMKEMMDPLIDIDLLISDAKHLEFLVDRQGADIQIRMNLLFNVLKAGEGSLIVGYAPIQSTIDIKVEGGKLVPVDMQNNYERFVMVENGDVESARKKAISSISPDSVIFDN